MKRVRAIPVDAVSAIFNDNCLKQLARDGKLPPGANYPRFARSVRGAVCDFVLAVRAPTSNDLHREIKALHSAADREQYDELANLLDRLSPAARAWLNQRGQRPGWQSIYGSQGAKLPTANEVREPTRRKEACTLVRGMCTAGGRIIEGRRRSTGKRSLSYQTVLDAPTPSRHFSKREAELALITSLQLSFVGATGKMPALTARRGFLGPFARMTQKVFHFAGAAHADVVGLINELNRRRIVSERRTQRVGTLSGINP